MCVASPASPSLYLLLMCLQRLFAPAVPGLPQATGGNTKNGDAKSGTLRCSSAAAWAYTGSFAIFGKTPGLWRDCTTDVFMCYVELHARSAFSFLEGASVPEAIVYACARQQIPAIAVLDRNGFYGSPRAHLTGKSNDIKAHVGVELSV